MTQCPCGSTQNYNECCQPIHFDHSLATTPEQLMRARYSAHVKNLVDFVIETYHPSCNAGEQAKEIEASVLGQWDKLEVLDTEKGSHDNEGYVSFKAFFTEQGQSYCMEERSRFIREKDLWYYIDGELNESNLSSSASNQNNRAAQSTKVGRNDPCSCGSGKKFKKCCG